MLRTTLTVVTSLQQQTAHGLAVGTRLQRLTGPRYKIHQTLQGESHQNPSAQTLWSTPGWLCCSVWITVMEDHTDFNRSTSTTNTPSETGFEQDDDDMEHNWDSAAVEWSKATTQSADHQTAQICQLSKIVCTLSCNERSNYRWHPNLSKRNEKHWVQPLELCSRNFIIKLLETALASQTWCFVQPGKNKVMCTESVCLNWNGFICDVVWNEPISPTTDVIFFFSLPTWLLQS